MGLPDERGHDLLRAFLEAEAEFTRGVEGAIEGAIARAFKQANALGLLSSSYTGVTLLPERRPCDRSR